MGDKDPMGGTVYHTYRKGLYFTVVPAEMPGLPCKTSEVYLIKSQPHICRKLFHCDVEGKCGTIHDRPEIPENPLFRRYVFYCVDDEHGGDIARSYEVNVDTVPPTVDPREAVRAVDDYEGWQDNLTP